jgi:hypothetical protein
MEALSFSGALVSTNESTWCYSLEYDRHLYSTQGVRSLYVPIIRRYITSLLKRALEELSILSTVAFHIGQRGQSGLSRISSVDEFDPAWVTGGFLIKLEDLTFFIYVVSLWKLAVP